MKQLSTITEIPRLIDLDLLKTFISIAHNGSFTAAAKVLHRTQSTISMQMQRLEEQLDCVLLMRLREGTTLTPDGVWLLPRAQQLLTLNNDLFFERKLSRVAGRVRIGATEHYATAVLPQLLAQFCLDFPEVQFDLRIGIPSAMRPRLGMDYDLLVGVGPKGVAQNSGVPGTTVLAHYETVWACSGEAEIWRRRPLPLALHQEGSGVRAWAIAALDGAGIAWREVCSCGSLVALETAVRAGLGVSAFVSQSIGNRLEIIGPDQGLPLLPRTEVWIAKAEGTVAHATTLLHEYLVEQIRTKSKKQ